MIALHICKAKKKTKWHLRLKSQICDEKTLVNFEEKGFRDTRIGKFD